MRILMLGWEFPPLITGGLGVACFGLTKALDEQGHEVIFILPRPLRGGGPSHLHVLSPGSLRSATQDRVSTELDEPQDSEALVDAHDEVAAAFTRATFHSVPASFASPYPDGSSLPSGAGGSGAGAGDIKGSGGGSRGGSSGGGGGNSPHDPARRDQGGAHDSNHGSIQYGFDLVGDAERYARLVVSMTRRLRYDVIHAHDWLTFPAGMMLAQIARKPLIVQVHSTEFDRAGQQANARIVEVERAGMQAADRVLAVSQLTKSICVRRYGVPPNKIEVVYNGVETPTQPAAQTRVAEEHIRASAASPATEKRERIVLFLGRITMQKGPEYFITAARRVLDVVPDVKFVLAGSGDMALRMMEMAARLGIGERVLFTGFLEGKAVERIYRMADCYVMPSVSEPFGISALEAVSHNVPAIISRTSGASEVLQHVLKVDFWDTDDMANKIIAVLRYAPLAQTMRDHGAAQIGNLSWESVAERVVSVYESALEQNARAG
jgi:glycogen(starch) synthase